MRLIDFLINEKITQKEIGDVFNNNNIFIGAEFEFIHNEIEEEITQGYDQEVLQKRFVAALSDWDQWTQEIKEWQERERELYTQIDDIESELGILEDEITNLRLKKDELDDEEEEELENIQDELDDKLKEFEDLEQKKAEHEVDLDIHQTEDFPEPGLNYVDYMEEVHNINVDTMDIDLPEPEPLYSMEMESINEEKWIELAENILPDSIYTANFISDYKIGGYGSVNQTKENQVWAFEFDSTVFGDGGVEMKSPPMQLPKFLNILPDILKWINKNGTTNENCGLHFHMSLDNVNNLQANLDIVKLILFTEEEFIYKFFPSRIDNVYAKQIKNKVIQGGPSQIKEYAQKLVDKKNLNPEDARSVLGDHYDAVHKVSDSKNFTHVEFRHLGGKNYHKKTKEIKSLIGKYAVTLSLACDPNYKHKEYISKIVRIVNKIDKFILKKLYEYFGELIEGAYKNKETKLKKFKQLFDDEPFITITENSYMPLVKLIEQRMKNLRQEINNLNVEVSSKESRVINNKVQFTNIVEQEKDIIKEKLRKRGY